MLKNKILNKKYLVIVIVGIIVLIAAYLNIKNEFFYHAKEYITRYFDYYIGKYLGGNANNLIIDNSVFLYIENDLISIYSCFYIYCITHSNIIYIIFMIIMPLLIFYLINSSLFDEVHNKFCSPIINRIGIKKYTNLTILYNGFISGTLIVIPKIIFLMFLLIIFPNELSVTHFINELSTFSQAYLYVGYPFHPVLLIILDIIFGFIYGFIVSLISNIIITKFDNRSLSYIIFIITISLMSLLFMILSQSPFILFYSLFSYFDYKDILPTLSYVFSAFILLFSLFIILLIINKLYLKKKISEVL